jgi:hypothetical protein
VGDQFLVFLAYRAVRDTDIANRLRKLFPDHGLCRLVFPDDFVDVGRSTEADLKTWTTGQGSCVMEALQQELCENWLRVERNKAEITHADEMVALGQMQEGILNRLLDELEERKRKDLARFLLRAAWRLVRDAPEAEAWTGRLNVWGLSLAQRTAVYRAALAFLHGLERLRCWQEQARAVGYLDEGYAASQLWKADWERFHGDASCALATAVTRRLDPMRSAGQTERTLETPPGQTGTREQRP